MGSTKHIVKHKWNEAKRLEVVQAYILTGSLQTAAAMCNVPLPTAKVWRITQWFKDLELELRQGSKLRLSSKLSKVVDASIDVLADRIENGDYVWQKGAKEYTRKPITAEVAQKITAQLIDRTLQVEKAAIQGVVTDEGLDARLEKLRQEMRDFAKRPSLKPIESEIIDVIPVQLEEPLRQPLGEVPEESATPTNHSGPRGWTERSRPTPARDADRDPSTIPGDSSLRVTLA